MRPKGGCSLPGCDGTAQARLRNQHFVETTRPGLKEGPREMDPKDTVIQTAPCGKEMQEADPDSSPGSDTNSLSDFGQDPGPRFVYL